MSEFLTSTEFLRGFSENSIAQKFDAKDRKEGTDYQIAIMKNRIIRCTQGLFGSQSLLYSVYVFSQKVPLYIPTSSGSLNVVNRCFVFRCASQQGEKQSEQVYFDMFFFSAIWIYAYKWVCPV